MTKSNYERYQEEECGRNTEDLLKLKNGRGLLSCYSSEEDIDVLDPNRTLNPDLLPRTRSRLYGDYCRAAQKAGEVLAKAFNQQYANRILREIAYHGHYYITGVNSSAQSEAVYAFAREQDFEVTQDEHNPSTLIVKVIQFEGRQS